MLKWGALGNGLDMRLHEVKLLHEQRGQATGLGSFFFFGQQDDG